MPISKWMSEFILDQLPIYEEIRNLQKKIAELEAQNKELAAERKFYAPCSVCGKPIYFSSKQSGWKIAIYPKLKEVFGKRRHIKCPK